MAIDFPATPSVGTIFTAAGASWRWNGVKWISATAPGPAVITNDVGRNLVHNSLFNIQQRGAGPWGPAGQYTLDRWRLDTGSDTSTVTTSPFGMAGTIGDEAAVTALVVNVNGNAAAGSFTIFSQPIENVRRLSGKTVTVSFIAYSTSGTPKLGVNIRQYVGTGGTPSGGGDLPGTSVTLSTTPTRYSLTFALPSLAGATLGTNNDNFNRLTFWPSCGTANAVSAGSPGVQTYTLVLWGVQLEIGSVATPLEKIDPQQDLAKCQRFYCTGNFAFGGYSAAGIACSYVQPLPVTMRAAPTMTPNVTNNTNTSGPGLVASTPTDFRIQTGIAATGGFSWIGGYTATADL